MRKTSFLYPLVLILILSSSSLFLLFESIHAVEETGFYSYDEATSSWTWIPGIWTPTRTEEKTYRSITICVKGLPSDVAANVYVDGNLVGPIQGSGCRTFIVSKSEAHTFCVDDEIGGACSTYEGTTVCTRYRSPGTCWTVEAIKKERICESVPICRWVCEYSCPCPDCPEPVYCGEGCIPPPCPSCPCAPKCGYVCIETRRCHYEEELGEQEYTFEYFAEHQVFVSNPHGDNIDEWVRDGNTVNFYAEEEVSIKDEQTVKERDVFDHWSINGAPNENTVTSLTINKPYVAKAKYTREREYYIEASSSLRKTNPTGSSWYPEDGEASLSVEEEIPLEGWKGSWGGKYIFMEWRGDKGTVLRRASSTFTVEEPSIEPGIEVKKLKDEIRELKKQLKKK